MVGRGRRVEGFVEEWAAAEQRGDATFLRDALTDDFVGVGSAGFVLTKEQWLGHFAGGLAYESFALEEVDARLYGEVAVLTARQKQAGSFRGNDVGGGVPGDRGAGRARRPLAAGRVARQPYRRRAFVFGPLNLDRVPGD